MAHTAMNMLKKKINLIDQKLLKLIKVRCKNFQILSNPLGKNLYKLERYYALYFLNIFLIIISINSIH